jgi:hypothetical protein
VHSSSAGYQDARMKAPEGTRHRRAVARWERHAQFVVSTTRREFGIRWVAPRSPAQRALALPLFGVAIVLALLLGLLALTLLVLVIALAIALSVAGTILRSIARRKR